MPEDDKKPANSNEGADPSDDIRTQNPGSTTTADLAKDDSAEDLTEAHNPEPDRKDDDANAGSG